MKHTLWLAAAATACSSGPDEPPAATEPCVLALPPADEETEHLLVFNETGGPICPGTLRSLDLEVERLVQELGLPLDAPIPFYYGIEPAIEMCDYDSGIQYGGCAKGLGCETFVASSSFPQVHELVHAIRRRNHLTGPDVLEEGIAVLLGDGRPFNGVHIGVASFEKRSMLELVELERDELAEGLYAYGSHFLSFAIDQHGLDAVTDVLADERYPDELDELFRTHLGTSLTELDEQWRAQAWDTSYTSYDVCREIVELGSGFELHAALDCGNDQTLGHFAAPLFAWPIDTCLVTTEPVDVSIVTMGGPGIATLSGRDCAPEDVANVDLVTGFTLPVPVDSEMRLGRCTWWAYFSAEWAEAPSELELHVEPR